MLLEHMHEKFEINRTKNKGGCQLVRKVVTHNSKSDLPLVIIVSLTFVSRFFHQLDENGPMSDRTILKVEAEIPIRYQDQKANFAAIF